MSHRQLPPAAAELVERHASLEEPVRELLEAAGTVRELTALVFPDRDLPRAERGEDYRKALQHVEQNLEDLEAESTRTTLEADAVERAARALLVSVAELRAASHGFAPRRSPAAPQQMPELVAAMQRAQEAFARLEKQARAAHCGRLPWQLELACFINPHQDERKLELVGDALPGTPASRRAWGERCTLLGTEFYLDSRANPVPRFRSLDSCYSVLSPEGYELVRRWRRALERVRESAPDAVEAAARLYPFLFEEFVAEDSGLAFSRLGLLDFPSLAVGLNNTLRTYSRRPLFGSRDTEGDLAGLGVAARWRRALGQPGGTSPYEWETFDSVRRACLAMAAALELDGLPEDGRVGILMSRNRREFYVADFACVFGRMVSVGLQPSQSPEQMAATLEQAQLSALVVDREAWLKYEAQTGVLGGIDRIYVVGDGDEWIESDAVVSLEKRLEDESLQGHVTRSGIGPDTPTIYGDDSGLELAESLGVARDDEDRLYTVIFTSGSTGRPKGTQVSRLRWSREMCVEIPHWPYVVSSFQSSAVAADRAVVWSVLYNGGRVGFARRGESLFSDVRAIRPTLFDVAPVIWNTIYSEYKRALADPSLDRAEVAAVRQRFRDYLGGRVTTIATGGAPSDPGVRAAMERIFGVKMSEGYGTTETGHIAYNGVLVAGLDHRLVDRPELGYTRADKPFPRGELAVKTARTTTRYFNDEASSRDSFTDDGYFLTGDLVELEPGGKCRIVGRRKQVFKLAGAEFVSPEVLESVYGRSELVENVLITARPHASQVVAVVVPSDPEVSKAELLAELRSLGRDERLRACDLPASVVVVARAGGESPWTAENGLLTPSFKVNRRALEERFSSEIDQAYAEEPRDLPTPSAPSMRAGGDSGEEILQSLRQLVASVLGMAVEEVDPRGSFADHGGDSLASMDLVLRLEQIFSSKSHATGIWSQGPAAVVAAPLEELAQTLASGQPDVAEPLPEAAAVESPERDDVEDVPAAGESAVDGAGEAAVERAREEVSEGSVPASDSCCDPCADADLSVLSDGEVPPDSAEPHIFLTGGSGFLGAHLLARLSQSAEPGARIYALVRARDDAHAAQRVEAVFEQYELGTPDVGTPGSESRIVAFAGQLHEPKLGVDEELWRELAASVGTIYHVAAEVSGEASYSALRQSNVLGTLRMLELASSRTLKALHFVSSLNVTLMLQQVSPKLAAENVAVPRELPETLLAKSSGYAVSKWVGERLVQNLVAATAGRFRASISRPALVTWSTRSGCANRSDWLPQLLSSCLRMRAVLAPDEVAVPRWTPETVLSARGLDMVPVDFCALAVERMGEATSTRNWPGGVAAQASPLEAPRAPLLHISNVAPAEHGLVTFARLMDLLTVAALEFDDETSGDAGQSKALETVPRLEWLLRAELESAPIVPVLDGLRDSQPAFARTRAESFSRFLGGAVSGVQCPPIDAAYLRRFVAWEDAIQEGD